MAKKADLELYIKAGKTSPEVKYDGPNNILEIKGISVPRDAKKFYEPVVDWLTGNWNKIKNKFILVLWFNFFNPPSAKMLMEIFKQLVDLSYSGAKKKTVKINWYYTKGDEDLKEAGMIYAEMFPDLKFEFIEDDPEED